MLQGASLMWRVFTAAVLRKLAYVLVALAASFLLGRHAHAQTFSYPALTITQGSVPEAATGQAWCNAWLAVFNPYWVGHSGGTTQTGVTATPSGAPSNGTTTLSCVSSPGSFAQSNHSAASTLACSSGAPNLDLLTTVGGGVGYIAGGGYCVNGCEYTNGNFAVTFGGGTQRLAGKAVPTGVACGVSGTVTTAQAPATNQTCQIKSGATTCIDSVDNIASQQNVPNGTFSVISLNVPSTSGTCAGYADGGVACNAGTSATMQTPPGPSTATDTAAPATPTVVVSDPTTGHNVMYYNPTVANASKGPVGAVVGASGNPLGTTTATGTGGGTSGTGPSAANGDCAASSVNCAGDSTLPSLARSDTIQSDVQAYWDSVAASPIVVAFSSISGSWPTASCPTVPFTLTVFKGSHDFDAMAPVCTVWGGTVAPTLSLVFLALWAVAGIRVILSA